MLCNIILLSETQPFFFLVCVCVFNVTRSIYTTTAFNNQQGVALCLTACLQLAALHTHTHTHTHTEALLQPTVDSPDLSVTEIIPFISSRAKLMWIYVIKHVTLCLPPGYSSGTPEMFWDPPHSMFFFGGGSLVKYFEITNWLNSETLRQQPFVISSNC